MLLAVLRPAHARSARRSERVDPRRRHDEPRLGRASSSRTIRELGLGVAHVLDEVDHHDRVELHAREGLVGGDARVERRRRGRAFRAVAIASALRSMP